MTDIVDLNGKIIDSKFKKDLAARVQGLILENTDIILIKEQYVYDRLIELGDLFGHLKKKIAIMLVKDFDDLKALSEMDLNGLGWYKREIKPLEDLPQ